MDRSKVTALVILVVIAYPVVYLTLLNAVSPRRGLKLHTGWEDDSFTEGWALTDCENESINAIISTENRMLKLVANGTLLPNFVVSAQRLCDLELNLSVYRYLNISIMTSAIDVAAQVTIGTDSTHNRTVLLKTYNDKNWHTEIIDLSYFGLTGPHLYMIELGMMQVSEGSESVTCYRELSFNRLE